jgi:hypothetical protein
MNLNLTSSAPSNVFPFSYVSLKVSIGGSESILITIVILFSLRLKSTSFKEAFS